MARVIRLVPAVLTAAAVLLTAGAVPAFTRNPAPVFVNELHYDNSGLDQNEAVEVAGPAGTGLSDWRLSEQRHRLLHRPLCTLLVWHEEDLVDDGERRRNDVIFAWQHNRNPFVDHPEWVQRIWVMGADEQRGTRVWRERKSV